MRAAATRVRRARARAGGRGRDRRRALRQRLPRSPRGRCRGARPRAQRARLPRSSHSTCRAGSTARAAAWRAPPSRPRSRSRSTGARSAPRSSPGAAAAGEVVELPIGLPVALAGPRARAAHGSLRPRARAAALADGLEVRRGRRARRRRLAGHERGSRARRAGGLPRGAGVVWVVRARERARGGRGHAPELMVHGDLAPERVLELAARAARRRRRARASGARRREHELVDALVRRVEAPLVLDADALFALAGRLETLRERPGPTALTPHAGELGRLLGRDSAEIARRGWRASARRPSARGAAVLLKGPDTLVAAPGEPLRVVETSVPQLATAGAGDVLAGAVGSALRARAAAGARARARPPWRTARPRAWPSPRRAPSSPPTCCCRWRACCGDALHARGRPRSDARECAAPDRGRRR